jgi:NDP-sugar pyrophosphorylase family protein
MYEHAYHIDYGATALRRSALDGVSLTVASGLDALTARLAGDYSLLAYVVTERFYEIGSPDGLRDLESYLAQIPGLDPNPEPA